MRLLNYLLYSILTLFLFCCFKLEAQQVFNAPTLVEGAIASGDSVPGPKYTTTFPTQVNSGELIVACGAGDAGSLPWTVSSSPSETWNHTTVTTSGSFNTQLWYTTATSTASYTVQIAFTGGNTAAIAAAHYAHISGTIDGSIATNSASGSPSTLATTQTTTVNNDLLVSCGEGRLPQTPAYFVAFDQSSNAVFQYAMNAGAKGSQTFTMKNASQTLGGSGNLTDMVMQTAAFSPTGIFLGDTSLPDAASGVTYEAQLHCIGGTNTQTYSLVSGSLPAGLSLNTASGEITGSTVVTGTSTLGFRCTDGTLTSATDTLTLKVGAAFNNPNIRQSFMALNATVNNTFSSPVQCGSVLGVIMHGPNTHGGEGWVLNDSGSAHFVKDANGNILHRVQLFGSNTVAPVTAYVSDPINYSGTATINIGLVGGHGGPLMSTFFECQGCQFPMQQATYDNVARPITIANYNIANSYTSKVPNELALGITVSSSDQDTYSVAAPFTLIQQGYPSYCPVGFDCMAFSSDNIVSASTVTLTTTVNAFPQYDNGTQVLFGLRPALPASGCAVAPTGPQGEKFRRQIF